LSSVLAIVFCLRRPPIQLSLSSRLDPGPFFPSCPCRLSPNLRLLSHIFLDISATCLFRCASHLTATDSFFFFPSVSPRNPVESADADDPFEWRRGAGCRESVSCTCSSSGKSFAFVFGIASSPPPAPRSRPQSSLFLSILPRCLLHPQQFAANVPSTPRFPFICIFVA
jgi:hypothetical protein